MKKFLSKERIILYAPLLLIEFYLLFTLILFAFGPVEWPITNSQKMYTFIFLYHLSFVLGYIVRMKKRYKAKEKSFMNLDKIVYLKKKIRLFLNKYMSHYLCVGLLILFVVNYFRLARVVNSINPIDMIKYVYYGLFNSYELYQLKFILNQNDLIGGRFITMMTTLLSPIYWPIYPLSIYYFKKIDLKKKILFIISILLEIGYAISIGTNKVFFDLIIITCTIISVKFFCKMYREKCNFKKIFIIFFLVLFGLLLVFIFFYFTMKSRLGGLNRFSDIYMPGININLEKNIIKYMPDMCKFIYVLLCIYLSQGYFGMSLALKLPFKSTYGLGNNNFILSNIEELFSCDIRQNLYQNRIVEFGWDPTVNWHTIYTWIANDVSFYGVIIFMYVLGYVFSAIWSDVILFNNIIAICLIPLFVIMFIFIPCNNQVFSLPTTFMPFVFLFLLWILNRNEGDCNECN